MKITGKLPTNAVFNIAKRGLVSTVLASSVFIAFSPVVSASASTYTNAPTHQLTDAEIYENVQKIDLPDYVNGSLNAILNQKSSLYSTNEYHQSGQAIVTNDNQYLTDTEIYENAQKLDLPDYVNGSLSGILNQHSSLYH